MAVLILVCGLPGTGKTTVASAFAAATGALHVNSDVLRKKLGLMGHYTPADKARVYEALIEEAKTALMGKRPVIVDSTFYQEKIREPFRRLATDCGAELYWIMVGASEPVIRERVGKERADSEADFAVYEKIRDAFEPLAGPCLQVWSDRQSLPDMVTAIGEYVRRGAGHVTFEQIQTIVDQGLFPGRPAPAEVVETHISWVILTPDFAFKIKKPVGFHFLDFRTLYQREYSCREELRLNRRLAPQMYLDVLPVGRDAGNTLRIGGELTETIDFAVQMKRIDNRCQMDVLLAQNKVSSGQMYALGSLIASFHREHVLRPEAVGYQPGDMQKDFNDLFSLVKPACGIVGEAALATFEFWQKTADRFLKRYEPLVLARIQNGDWVDGHGDLHARNIFLLPEGPLVFDCIEFNPHFRKIDRLNELAFLCMDLDANGRAELSADFMRGYREKSGLPGTPDEISLFLYYKAYRANVRLKIALLEWAGRIPEVPAAAALRYWNLLDTYMRELVEWAPFLRKGS
ncbi:MAG: AAA family ATPase [Saprospiraceae bacterium]|nr:AAA family ATPase [Saprospiraceae bacterium]